MADKPLIVMCRHGRTASNAESAGESGELIRSWRDLPLTTDGRKDAEELANKLKSFDIEKIYASDLHRAMETAEAVADKFGLPVNGTRALRPWNLGYLIGTSAKKAVPVMKRYVDNEDQTIPGGESFSTFRKRCLEFVVKVSQEARRDGHVICLVSHTRCLQLTKAFIAAGAPKDLHIDREAFDDYSDEISTGGYLEIEPGDVLGPEWKDGIEHDEDEGA